MVGASKLSESFPYCLFHTKEITESLMDAETRAIVEKSVAVIQAVEQYYIENNLLKESE